MFMHTNAVYTSVAAASDEFAGELKKIPEIPTAGWRSARKRWGPAAGLAVGGSCLAIPLAGGVRPPPVSLGPLHAECCSEPLGKHLGISATQ